MHQASVHPFTGHWIQSLTAVQKYSCLGNRRSLKGHIPRQTRFAKGLTPVLGGLMSQDLGANLLHETDGSSSCQAVVSPADYFQPESEWVHADVEDDLDFVATVSIWETIGLGSLSTAACVVLAKAIGVARIGVYSGLGLAMMWAGCIGLARIILLETKYEKKRRPEAGLADAESKFCTVEQTSVHFKSHRPQSSPSIGIHLYHGFGANVYSWKDVQKPLSKALNACVTSHDTPGFGLTQRPSRLEYYSLEYNGFIGQQVCQGELEEMDRERLSKMTGSTTRNVDPSYPAQKAIFVGHSMGCVSAAHAVVNNPNMVAGVVFVDPALFVPKHPSKGRQNFKTGSTSTKHDRKMLMKRCAAVYKSLLKTSLKILAGWGAWLSQPFIILSLRWSIRSKAFWINGLRRAFYNKDIVNDRVLTSYRLPQLVRGCERGLARFVRSRNKLSIKDIVQDLKYAWQLENSPSLLQQLEHTLQEHKINTLIIHGDDDALIPLSTSKRLANLLPNTQLRVFPNCGHNPQEECPQKFVDVFVDWAACLK